MNLNFKNLLIIISKILDLNIKKSRFKISKFTILDL